MADNFYLHKSALYDSLNESIDRVVPQQQQSGRLNSFDEVEITDTIVAETPIEEETYEKWVEEKRLLKTQIYKKGELIQEIVQEAKPGAIKEIMSQIETEGDRYIENLKKSESIDNLSLQSASTSVIENNEGKIQEIKVEQADKQKAYLTNKTNNTISSTLNQQESLSPSLSDTSKLDITSKSKMRLKSKLESLRSYTADEEVDDLSLIQPQRILTSSPTSIKTKKLFDSDYEDLESGYRSDATKMSLKSTLRESMNTNNDTYLFTRSIDLNQEPLYRSQIFEDLREFQNGQIENLRLEELPQLDQSNSAKSSARKSDSDNSESLKSLRERMGRPSKIERPTLQYQSDNESESQIITEKIESLEAPLPSLSLKVETNSNSTSSFSNLAEKHELNKDREEEEDDEEREDENVLDINQKSTDGTDLSDENDESLNTTSPLHFITNNNIIKGETNEVINIERNDITEQSTLKRQLSQIKPPVSVETTMAKDDAESDSDNSGDMLLRNLELLKKKKAQKHQYTEFEYEYVNENISPLESPKLVERVSTHSQKPLNLSVNQTQTSFLQPSFISSHSPRSISIQPIVESPTKKLNIVAKKPERSISPSLLRAPDVLETIETITHMSFIENKVINSIIEERRQPPQPPKPKVIPIQKEIPITNRSKSETRVNRSEPKVIWDDSYLTDNYMQRFRYEENDQSVISSARIHVTPTYSGGSEQSSVGNYTNAYSTQHGGRRYDVQTSSNNSQVTFHKFDSNEIIAVVKVPNNPITSTTQDIFENKKRPIRQERPTIITDRWKEWPEYIVDQETDSSFSTQSSSKIKTRTHKENNLRGKKAFSQVEFDIEVEKRPYLTKSTPSSCVSIDGQPTRAKVSTTHDGRITIENVKCIPGNEILIQSNVDAGRMSSGYFSGDEFHSGRRSHRSPHKSNYQEFDVNKFFNKKSTQLNKDPIEELNKLYKNLVSDDEALLDRANARDYKLYGNLSNASIEASESDNRLQSRPKSIFARKSAIADKTQDDMARRKQLHYVTDTFQIDPTYDTNALQVDQLILPSPTIADYLRDRTRESAIQNERQPPEPELSQILYDDMAYRQLRKDSEVIKPIVIKPQPFLSQNTPNSKTVKMVKHRDATRHIPTQKISSNW